MLELCRLPLNTELAIRGKIAFSQYEFITRFSYRTYGYLRSPLITSPSASTNVFPCSFVIFSAIFFCRKRNQSVTRSTSSLLQTTVVIYPVLVCLSVGVGRGEGVEGKVCRYGVV